MDKIIVSNYFTSLEYNSNIQRINEILSSDKYVLSYDDTKNSVIVKLFGILSILNNNVNFKLFCQCLKIMIDKKSYDDFNLLFDLYIDNTLFNLYDINHKIIRIFNIYSDLIYYDKNGQILFKIGEFCRYQSDNEQILSISEKCLMRSVKLLNDNAFNLLSTFKTFDELYPTILSSRETFIYFKEKMLNNYGKTSFFNNNENNNENNNSFNNILENNNSFNNICENNDFFNNICKDDKFVNNICENNDFFNNICKDDKSFNNICENNYKILSIFDKKNTVMFNGSTFENNCNLNVENDDFLMVE